jgi:short-subunit dehydrogenase involved in D-alanine esterification of teichoic acids
VTICCCHRCTAAAAFKDWLKNNYGSLTILVNNAGFAYKGDVFGPDEVRGKHHTPGTGLSALQAV